MAGVLELPDVIPSWAEGGDILQPSDAEIAVGWPLSSVPPSRQRFNWVLNWLMNASRYSLQTGIPEWSATENYGLAYVQRDSKTYMALQPSVNKDPLTQPAYWMRWGFSQLEIDQILSLGQGPGKIDMFARNTPPAGWLKANGAIVSREVYANLFDSIGATWGAGDGITTFQLPDLRGYFLRMWDDGRGIDVGRAFSSIQSDDNKAHSHGIKVSSEGLRSPADYNRALYSTVASSPTGSTEVSGGTESRPKNIALLGCIRY